MDEPRVYAVILPIDTLPVGVPIPRSAWPLHVTLVTNVRASAGLDLVVAVVREAAARIPVLTTTVRESAWFGPAGDVLVDLVDDEELRPVHMALVDALETNAGAVPLVAAYHHAGYRPHVTASPVGRARRGDRLTLRTVALVEIGPGGRTEIAVPLAVFDLAWTTRQPVPAVLDAAAVIRLSTALTSARVRHWVIGGWGVDALLGTATRDHHDLDVLVHADDVPALLAVLDGLGMTLRFLWSENRSLAGSDLPSAFVADGPLGELDVHVIALEGDRPVPLYESTVELPAGALAAIGEIGGAAVPCASPEAQLLMHSGYELPAAHRRDVEHLRSILAR